MKKGVLLTVACSILAVGVTSYFWLSSNRTDNLKLTEQSIDVANTVASFYRGSNNIEELKSNSEDYIKSDVYLKLNDYLDSLTDLNDRSLNLTEYYDDRGFGEDEDPIGEEAEKYGVDKLFSVVGDKDTDDDAYSTQQEDIPDDTRIYTDSGIAYIKVKDLDFSDGGSDLIFFRGSYFEVNKVDVEETYDMIINNPEYIFNYSIHKKSDTKDGSYVDVLFDSAMSEDKSLMVRVHISDGKIVNFEVIE